MSCQKVLKSISAFLDERLAGDERQQVFEHLSGCRECAKTLDHTRQTREVLRSLPQLAPPPLLASRLRVLASHECARRLAYRSLGSAARFWGDRFRLLVDNMMRPFAIPFAGGVLSAFVLFSMLVPSLNFLHNFRDDVRVASFYTDAAVLEMAPFYLDEDVVVELTIDGNGQVVEYSVPHGQLSREEATHIGNLMLFTSFTPATWFGHPTSGKITVSLRRSHIVVKG